MSNEEQYQNAVGEYALIWEDDQPDYNFMVKEETFTMPYTNFAEMIGLSNKEFRTQLSDAERGEIDFIPGKNEDEFVFGRSKEYDIKPNVLKYKEHIDIYLSESSNITSEHNMIVVIKDMDTYLEFIDKYPEFIKIVLEKISEQNERGKDRKRLVPQLTPDEEEQAGYIADLLKN